MANQQRAKIARAGTGSAASKLHPSCSGNTTVQVAREPSRERLAARTGEDRSAGRAGVDGDIQRPKPSIHLTLEVLGKTRVSVGP